MSQFTRVSQTPLLQELPSWSQGCDKPPLACRPLTLATHAHRGWWAEHAMSCPTPTPTLLWHRIHCRDGGCPEMWSALTSWRWRTRQALLGHVLLSTSAGRMLGPPNSTRFTPHPPEGPTSATTSPASMDTDSPLRTCGQASIGTPPHGAGMQPTRMEPWERHEARTTRSAAPPFAFPALRPLLKHRAHAIPPPCTSADWPAHAASLECPCAACAPATTNPPTHPLTHPHPHPHARMHPHAHAHHAPAHAAWRGS